MGRYESVEARIIDLDEDFGPVASTPFRWGISLLSLAEKYALRRFEAGAPDFPKSFDVELRIDSSEICRYEVEIRFDPYAVAKEFQVG